MQTQFDHNIGDTKKAHPNKDKFHNISSNIPSMAENLDKKEYEEEEEELEMKAIPKGSQNFAFEEELNFKLIPNSHKQHENEDLPHSNSTTRNSQNNIDGHKQSVLDILENVKDAKALMEMIERYQPKNKDISIGDIKASARTKLKRYKDCIYFGEIINSNRQGKGIMFYSDQRVYEGLWENNLKHGKGLEILTQGNRYEGQFLNGKPEGVGTFIWTNGEVYEGEWKNGLKHGSGMWKGMKGESYIGEWKNGKVDGYGVHTWRNGDRYEGELKGFLKHGHGAEKFINGDFYVGNYINGKPDGYGEYYWSNGCQYKGFFKNGLRHGKGIWKKAAENSDVYDGEWVNDKKCGNGTYVWASGNTYKGEYFNDMRHGYGEMYWVDGNYYKGAWEKGIQHGEGELMIPNKGIQKGLFENNVFAGEVNGDSKMNPFGGVTEKKVPNDIALNAISDSSRTMLPDINKSRGRMSERSRSQAGAQRNPARVAGNSLEKQALKKELSAPRKQLNLSHSKDKSNGEFKKFKESNDLEISTQVRKKPNLPIWKPACKPSAPTKKDRSYYL